ncbi:MAG: type II/IV secretion system ATPase subunit, partial [Candidatus Methanoplasma sp.]|nr:type II/IV secretion system ATPase subunit [Candidatus Methanoplasma sp.]
MPRILAAISDVLSRRSVTPVSYNDRLIVSEYGDAEVASAFNNPLSRTCSTETYFSPPSEFAEFDAPLSFPSDPTPTVPAAPARAPPSCGGSFMDDLSKMAFGHMRSKPVYADCWLVGSRGDLEKIEEYRTPSGSVMIGLAADGETEYNLTPNEYSYPDDVNRVVETTIGRVREKYRSGGGRLDRSGVLSVARGLLMDSSDVLEKAYGNDSDLLESMIGEICDTIYRYTMGLGVFDILLADPKLEDIYIDAPCEKNRIHVTMGGITGINSHIRCRTNLTVDRKEVMNLINVLKRESGLQFCESNPVLETDMSTHDARATVVGYPMSPNGDAVAIRKHSVRPWTLPRLIANGTVDPKMAGLLSFLIDNRSTFLVCGPRGAGKSSLLSALMFEFPVSQRILTIEDTIELPGSKMRRMGYKIQSMLIDDRMTGDSLSRADEALRVSLRMGESAIVLGEVRGEEARTLYQSMRTGRAGSSILGTIHGDSARSVFERVVHDMNIAPEAFMATDVLITLGTVRDRRTGGQIRRINEIVSTGDHPGEFLNIADGGTLFSSPVMRRIMSTSQMT